MACRAPCGIVLLRRGLSNAQPLLFRGAVRLLATRVGGEGGLTEQFRSGERADDRRALQAPGGNRVKMVSADRDFLLALPGSQQILLHDHRDTKFLKKVSAAGLATTLMSSSAVAYAMSFNLGPIACGVLAFQTVSAAVLFTMYLRTYVARAVLDARRSRLLITGCSYFGDVNTKDQEVPLMSLRPGADVGGHFIYFRMRGTPLDPSRWISYRMPRFQEGSARAPGAQVGFTPVSEPAQSSPAGKLDVLKAESRSAGSSSGAAPRRFPGARQGVAEDGFGAPRSGASAARTQAPSRGPSSAPTEEAKASAREADQSADKRKTLAGLKLEHGLPKDAREEQKILDFLDEPSAYAAFTVKQ